MLQEKIATNTDLLRFEEVLCVGEKHLFDTRVEHDRRYGSFMARIGPSPATMRVCEIDLYPMNGFCFILLLGLENKLLENGVVSRDDTV